MTEGFRTTKSRRCYHRVISGIERGGSLKFLTLTSSPTSPHDIQKSWHTLKARLDRRSLIKGYIKVPEHTKLGFWHLHVLFRGSYIEQQLIGEWWKQIHGAPIVDIRPIKHIRTNSRIAGYMAKYMCKENAGRYSWSWGWVWRGFSRDWQWLKRMYYKAQDYHYTLPFETPLEAWNAWIDDLTKPDFSPLWRLALLTTADTVTYARFEGKDPYYQ